MRDAHRTPLVLQAAAGGSRAARPCAPPSYGSRRGILSRVHLAIPLLLGTLVPAFGQQPAAGSERDLVFRSETALMEVEVEVTDRRGRPLPGLDREDFELLENGKVQRIATFEHIGPPGAAATTVEDTGSRSADEAAAVLGRSTFLYILARGRREDRRRMYDAITDFLDETLAPGILVSIQGSPFTSRRTELQEHLNAKLLARGPDADGLVDTVAVDLAREDILYDSSLEALIGEANSEFADGQEEIAGRSDLYRRVRMLEYIDLIRALGVYPGRKIVVLFSTGLTVDEDNLDLMKLLEDEATRSRVRFYVARSGGLEATPMGGDAERSHRVSIAALSRPNPFGAQNQARHAQEDGLVELAKRTGGRAILASNDLGQILNAAQQATGNYYLLGYYPDDTEQRGRLRRIRVRVAQGGVRVRHQRAYYEERPFQEMSRSERNLRMQQALAFDTPYADLPVRADFEFFRNSDGAATLAYAVGLHSRDIPSALAENRNGETVRLTVVARAARRGAEGQRPARPVLDQASFQMVVDSAAMDSLAEDPSSWLHYGSQMTLGPGEYDWKVVVRDDLSGSLGSYQTRIRVPPRSPGGSASSLLLTGRVDDVRKTKSGPARKRASEDVLTVAGSRFYANAVKAFRSGDPLFLLYDVYDPDGPTLVAPPPPMLALYRDGKQLQHLPVTSFEAVPEPAAARIRYLAALSTSNLAPGRYTIAAMVRRGKSTRSVISRGFVLSPAVR